MYKSLFLLVVLCQAMKECLDCLLQKKRIKLLKFSNVKSRYLKDSNKSRLKIIDENNPSLGCPFSIILPQEKSTIAETSNKPTSLSSPHV